MKALLTVAGVKTQEVTVGFPSPYCVADGYLGGLTEGDKAKGIDALLYFPDGVGFLHTLKHTNGGFEVYIGPHQRLEQVIEVEDKS
jgi:hypothetical protein